MRESIIETFVDERGNISVRVSREVQVLTHEEANRIAAKHKQLADENEKLRELVRDMLHWMPCQRPCQRCERYRYPDGCEFDIRRRKLEVDA